MRGPSSPRAPSPAEPSARRPLPLSGARRRSPSARASNFVGILQGLGRGVCVFLALPLSLVATACTRDINLLSRDGGGGGGTGGTPVTDASDAPTADTATNPTCTGLGPPIVLPTDTGAACAGALAAIGHRFALCSCDTMSAPARLRTDAFDSRNPAVTDEIAAAIGVGGDLSATGELRAGGAIYVAGANGVTASNQFRIIGIAARRRADEDAVLGQRRHRRRRVHQRQRHRQRARQRHPARPRERRPERRRRVRHVVVERDRQCALPVRLPRRLRGHRRRDRVRLRKQRRRGHRPHADRPRHRIDADVDSLPCGSFYLSTIDATAAVTIAVHGRALLAVGGDVTVRGGLAIQLDPFAELDLLVGGQVIASGGGALGAPGGAARFRVWIGGANTNVFDNAPTVNAIIHAPAGWVNAMSGLPLSGSILARSVSIGAETILHFDRAVLEAGSACNAPASSVVP